MADDDGGVRITLRDVYETAQRVENSVGLLVLGFEQLKTLTSDHENRLRTVEQAGRTAAALIAGAETDKVTTTDHEARIRAVERKVWSIPSFAVLIGVAALIVSILSVGANRAPAPSSNSSGRVPVTTPATSARARTSPQAQTVATSRTKPARRSTVTRATTPATTAPKPPSTITTSPKLPPVTLPPVVSKPLSEILASIP